MIKSSLYGPSIEADHLSAACVIIATQQLKAKVPLAPATYASPAIKAFLDDLDMLRTEILVGKPEQLRTIIQYVYTSFHSFASFLR